MSLRHSREWGVGDDTNFHQGKMDSEPTGEYWGGGGAFEMLYEHARAAGNNISYANSVAAGMEQKCEQGTDGLSTPL